MNDGPDVRFHRATARATFDNTGSCIPGPLIERSLIRTCAEDRAAVAALLVLPAISRFEDGAGAVTVEPGSGGGVITQVGVPKRG
jgi:hypothetical protein